MAKLIRSSEVELGANGRAHALGLRDAAQAHLRESWNIRWVDLGLAEAAMVLALFETSAHPQHDDASVEAALILLDKIIEALQLTTLDARDPDILDHSTGVPTVANPRPPPKQCDCAATAPPGDGSNTWSFQPTWDPLWTEADVKSEETRRLCWSALILVANHTTARAAEQREPLNLFLADSSNVCYSPFPLALSLALRTILAHVLLIWPAVVYVPSIVPFTLPWRISSSPRIRGLAALGER